MSDSFVEPAIIEGYHAHVYYDPTTRAAAERLRGGLDERFAVLLGRWHDVPVGPHPISMYQVAFSTAEFIRVVPWLMLNRGSLSILVHPLTGDDYEDHAHLALWLGQQQPLLLDRLPRRRSPHRGGDTPSEG
jgi:DOPA 4,5-dioxygenase